ncbi:unnamed protein product [Caenorhabditis angaria]|uniref:molybdopterin molybdotransferase n=1 Tax=Caenorhabditis angaria TaxID=860376 RepID=A0A9P1IUF2_9PELO|nr:unnamed protein product [Caenorhabditis angaria]
MKVAIVTVSDSCVAGTRIDQSGPQLQNLVTSSTKFQIENAVEISLVIDDVDEITKVLRKLKNSGMDVIITTGGTGFAKRDVTPEATLNVINRRCSGLEIAIHTHSLKSTPMAALSRSICGIADETLIINLPGSVKAVKECWEVIEPVLKHAVDLLKDSDDGNIHKSLTNK